MHLHTRIRGDTAPVTSEFFNALTGVIDACTDSTPGSFLDEGHTRR
jgi:hypothetical protein